MSSTRLSGRGIREREADSLPYGGDEAPRMCPWGAEIRPCAGDGILRYGQDDRGSGNGKDDYSGKRFESFLRISRKRYNSYLTNRKTYAILQTIRDS